MIPRQLSLSELFFIYKMQWPMDDDINKDSLILAKLLYDYLDYAYINNPNSLTSHAYSCKELFEMENKRLYRLLK